MISDYYFVILRAIDGAKSDPVRLRSLIYELARVSLSKQVLTRQDQEGGANLQRHVSELETAIQLVESNSHDDDIRLSNWMNVQALEALADSVNQDRMVEDDQHEDPIAADRGRTDTALAVRRNPVEILDEGYPLPAFLLPTQTWVPAHVEPPARLPQRVWRAIWPMLQLVVAATLGVAIYVGVTGRLDSLKAVGTRSDEAAQRPPPISKPPNQGVSASENVASTSPDAAAPGEGAPFPLPTTYGVYALSDGKLFELEALPIRAPDPRVAISAMITKPSTTTVPDGNLAFVVFRRDLATNALEKATVRVVARLASEMNYTETGKPAIAKIEDTWAIRSNAYEFRVAPVSQNRDMIAIQPADPALKLSPGRYALVLNGLAYDFTVDGTITDAVQCLERTAALNGPVYWECRKP